MRIFNAFKENHSISYNFMLKNIMFALFIKLCDEKILDISNFSIIQMGVCNQLSGWSSFYCIYNFFNNLNDQKFGKRSNLVL